MTLFTVSTVKGAPGGTTVALLLAGAIAATPSDSTGPEPTAFGNECGCLLVECDLAGGDVAPRLGLPGVPGLASLALVGRQGLTCEMLIAHTQTSSRLPGVRLLVGIAGPEQGLALGWMLESLAAALSDDRLRAVADLGRLSGEHDLNSTFRRVAAANLLVTADGVAALLHTRAAVESAADSGMALDVVLVGQRRHPLAHVAEATGAPVLGSVRVDSAALGALLQPRRAAERQGRQRGRARRFEREGGGLAGDIARIAVALMARAGDVQPSSRAERPPGAREANTPAPDEWRTDARQVATR